MDRWEYYNPNPAGNRVGDCAVRAICKATGFDWETVFAGLMVQACTLSDMPSANYVWGAYLYPMRRKTPCVSYGDIRRVHRIYASN